MKSDCHGAEIRTIEINLVPFDGVCSTCGAACFAVTEECQPAEPREAKEEHPGRWPCEEEFGALDEDELVQVEGADVLASREYILCVEREKEELQRGYDFLSAELTRVENENKSLRGDIKKLSDKLGYRL